MEAQRGEVTRPTGRGKAPEEPTTTSASSADGQVGGGATGRGSWKGAKDNVALCYSAECEELAGHPVEACSAAHALPEPPVTEPRAPALNQ